MTGEWQGRPSGLRASILGFRVRVCIRRFIGLFKLLLLQHSEQQQQQQQQQQGNMPIPPLEDLLRPVISRYIQRQQQQQQQQRMRQTVGQQESDDLFLLLQFSRRPFTAITQWILIAYKEMETAKEVLKQKQDRDCLQQQQMLRRIRQLRQQRALLQQQQQQVTGPEGVPLPQQQQQQQQPPGADEAIAAELRANEEEEQQLQQQLQLEINGNVREKVVSFFSTPRSFCQDARAAATTLEKGKEELQQQLLLLQWERGLGRSGSGRLFEVYRQHQRTAAAICRELECHRETWRVSRHRMLLWAEILEAYESLFPSAAAAALLDSSALRDLLDEHRKRLLEENFGPPFNRYSSRLDPVFTRRAARLPAAAAAAAAPNTAAAARDDGEQQHKQQQQQQRQQERPRKLPSRHWHRQQQHQQQQPLSPAAEAAAGIPRLLLSLGKTCELPLPASLHRRKAGVLLRNVVLRIAPLLTLDTWRQEMQQQQKQQQQPQEHHWVLFEAVDAALELQTLTGASLLCCLLSLEAYLCSGRVSVQKQTSSSSSNSSSSSSNDWQCHFMELTQVPFLRVAQNSASSGSSSSSSSNDNGKAAQQQQQLALPAPPPAAGDNSAEINSSSNNNNEKEQQHQQQRDGSRRQSLWQGAMEAINAAANRVAAVAAAAAPDAESAAARSRRGSLGDDTSRGTVPSRDSGIAAAKAAFQDSVRKGMQLQQQLMRHLSFLWIHLTALPLQQQQQQQQPLLRIGLPLYLQATARIQHVWGSLHTKQLQLLQQLLQHLLLAVCGAAVAGGKAIDPSSEESAKP